MNEFASGFIKLKDPIWILVLVVWGDKKDMPEFAPILKANQVCGVHLWRPGDEAFVYNQNKMVPFTAKEHIDKAMS